MKWPHINVKKQNMWQYPRALPLSTTVQLQLSPHKWNLCSESFLYSFTMYICIPRYISFAHFWAWYKWNLIVYYYSESCFSSSVFNIRLVRFTHVVCGSNLLCIFPLYEYMNIPQRIYSFIYWQASYCYQLGAMLKNAAVNTLIQISCYRRAGVSQA